MAEKLSDLFERERSSTVTWREQQIHSMFEMPTLVSGSTIRMTFDDPNPARPEGFRIRVRGGTLRIADEELDDVVLWSDSAPRVVEAEVHSAGGAVNARVWNCWRDPEETVHAWIGNAGMLVEQTENGYHFRCSDGFDEVTFDDLVVSLEIVSL